MKNLKTDFEGRANKMLVAIRLFQDTTFEVRVGGSKPAPLTFRNVGSRGPLQSVLFIYSRCVVLHFHLAVLTSAGWSQDRHTVVCQSTTEL